MNISATKAQVQDLRTQGFDVLAYQLTLGNASRALMGIAGEPVGVTVTNAYAEADLLVDFPNAKEVALIVL